MARSVAITALGMLLVSADLNGVIAQAPAPIGHRQPTASVVPHDDTVLAPATPAESSSAPRSAKEGRRLNGLVGFPDICSNCNR
jgi:hypothetical protein